MSHPPPAALFVVGCGRSGTTLVYEMLCRDPGFAWISTWADRAGRPEVAVANRLWRRRRGRPGRLAPLPSEGFRTWDRVIPRHPGASSPPLSGRDVDGEDAERAARMMSSFCRFGSGTVFLNKNTRNTRRIGFLAAAVPESVFLHVVRHPLDAVSSQLAVGWWPDLELWTHAGVSPRSLEADDVEQARLAAELWVAETGAARADARDLPSERFVEVRYEDVVTAPATALGHVLERLGSALDARNSPALESWGIRSSVGAYRSRLSQDQIDAAWTAAGELAARLGYAGPAA